jgi:hypothetical protein
MNETEIQNLVMVALSQEFGALVLRVNAGTFFGAAGNAVKGAPKGTSDLVACVPPGRFFGIEVKTETGRQSPAQVKFEAAVRKRGGVYLLVRSPQDAVAQVRAALEATA